MRICNYFAVLVCLVVLSGTTLAEEPKTIDPNGLELKLIKEELAKIQTKLDALTFGKRLDGIEDELVKLRIRMESLENRVLVNEQKLADGSPRIARSVEPETPKGTIQLENRSGVQVTVLLNNTAYPLSPGQTRTLENQTAGSFVYEVLAEGFGSIQSQRVRTLRPTRTFTISVNP